MRHPHAVYDLDPAAQRDLMALVDAWYRQDGTWWSLAPVSTLDLLRLLDRWRVPAVLGGLLAVLKVPKRREPAETASVDDRTAALLMERLRG